MATEVEVDVNINNNIEPTIANLKRLKRQLKDTAAGSDEFNRLSAQIRDLDDSIKDASATSDDFLGYLENADGPLGLFGKGIRNAEKTFSSFNGVLKASVIGLIVGLIGGLVAAFNDNEKAIKKLQPLFEGLEKIFNGIFSIVEPLFNTLVDLAVSALPLVSDAFGVVYSSVFAVVQSLGSLGSAVVKFIKGDFSGAWQDAKASVTDFGKNYEASVKRFNKGSKELTKKEKEESEKRRLARIEANKKQEEDFKKSIEETQKILDKRQQEDEKEYSERLSKVTTINARHLEKLQESQKNVTKVLFKSLTDNIDREIALEKKKSDELINIAQTEADAKANIQEAYINNLMRLGQGLRQIAGENKELAIAGIILEQSAAIASIALNSQKNFVKNGGVTSPLAWIGLAGDVAAGLSAVSAGVKGIRDIRSGTASGSNMSFGNPQMTPSYSTSPQFNVIGTSGVNQIAQVVGQNQQPIKAYVVGSEISSQQSLDRNKVMTASLG
jgi:hypothetical protein